MERRRERLEVEGRGVWGRGSLDAGGGLSVEEGKRKQNLLRDFKCIHDRMKPEIYHTLNS